MPWGPRRLISSTVILCMFIGCDEVTEEVPASEGGSPTVSEGQTAGAQAARSGASQGGQNEPLAGNNVASRTRAGGREGGDTPEAGVSARGGVSAPSEDGGAVSTTGGATQPTGGISAAAGYGSQAGHTVGGRQQDETEGGRSAAGGIPSNEPDIGGEMLSPCEPPLSIAPNQLYRAGFDLVTFRAEGGTGQYRYAFAENESGAILNGLTGVYLAGENQGTRDIVAVTDIGCVGSAEADVFVVSDLVVEPSEVEVGISGTVPFTLAGGSGQFTVEFVENNSGGQIDNEGQYRAGDRSGTDVIQVNDPLTGLRVEVIIQVSVDARLIVSESSVFLPVGSAVELDIEGGSGHVIAIADDPVAQMTQAGKITALADGHTRFAVTDRYTGMQASVDVQVASVVDVPLSRMGRGSSDTIIQRVGDINGDGFTDVIVAMSELSQRYVSDGIVAIYKGTQDGLEATPVRTIAGRARDDRLGRSIAVGDFNGDNLIDLAIGILNDDEAGSNAGATLIYHGRADAFFEVEPRLKLLGRRGGDQMGQALAACDFNGDGFLDLAVSAQRYEKRSRDLGLSDQGGISVYLGSDTGLSERPAFILDGHDFNNQDELVPRGGIRIGLSMAAGYIDADNLCDLVVGTNNRTFSGRRSGGMVQIYQGRATVEDPEYPEVGGLTERPVRVIYGDEENVTDGYLGRRVELGDLNGDGLADIIMAQHGYDGMNGNNSGHIRVFAGGPLDGPLRSAITVADADWSWLGLAGSDEAGVGLGVGDFNGDDFSDLIIGAWRGEGIQEDAEPNTGAAYVLLGQENRWPDAVPTLQVAEGARDQFFGESVEFLGDLDGDGQSELGVVAARAAPDAVRLAQAFVVSSAGAQVTPLDVPGLVAGHRLGRRVDLADVNGDGQPDLLMGAPDAPRFPNHLTAGGAFLALSDNLQAYPPESIYALTGHIDHSGSDLFGHGVLFADFDGDGAQDAVISAINDERPNGLDDTVYFPDASCRRSNNSGAIFIYRPAQALQGNVRPDFIIYGDKTNINLDVLGRADIDGDGRVDLIVGSHLGDTNGRDAGSFRVYFGRVAPADGTTTVICDAGLIAIGSRNGAQLGRSALGLGDLDGDGCDEFVVGEPNRRRDGDSNTADGAVWIVYGWSEQPGQCARTTPTYSLIAPAVNDIRFGTSLALLSSVPDGKRWLAVGAPYARRPDGNVRTGGVYLVDFDWILSRPRNRFDSDDVVAQVIGPGDTVQTYFGQTNEERYGTSLAGGEDLLVVGHQYRRYGDVSRVGGATIFRAANGVVSKVGSIIGETFGYEGGMAIDLALDNLTLTLAVGAHYSQATGAQTGGVYVFKLDGSLR